MRKITLFILAMAMYLSADTLNWSTPVRTLADGDNFYANEHWGSLRDTLSKIINSRITNINLSATALIDFSKMDSTKTAKAAKFKGDSLRLSGKAVVDSVHANSLKTKRAHIDTLKGITRADTITDLDIIYSRDIELGDTLSSRGIITIKGYPSNPAAIELDYLHYSWTWYAGESHSPVAGYALYCSPKGFFSLKFDTLTNMFRKGDFYDTGTVACSNVLTNYIQFGTTADSKCSTYIDTMVMDSAYHGATYSGRDSVRIVQIGASVSCYIGSNNLLAAMNGSEFYSIRGTPKKFMPNKMTFVTCPITEASGSYTLASGRFDTTMANGMRFSKYDNSYLASGNAGFLASIPVVIHWIK